MLFNRFYLPAFELATLAVVPKLPLSSLHELFVRLHRSAIVRRDFIAGFSRNASGRWIARLADGNEQPVGRLYADQVRAIAGR